MSKPTDEEIVQVLIEHGSCMTYAVTHWLRYKYRPLNTAYVLLRLKKLESARKVQRVKSAYKTQICWKAVR